MTLDRREALGAMGALVVGAAGLPSTRDRYDRLVRSGAQQPAFFAESERALMTVLADMVIPRDEKSGSATDSGALPFMEFVLSESHAATQQAWHAGVAWFDAESNRRFQTGFAAATDPQRGQILDDVAWPARATEAFRDQAAFFNHLRDLVASAFFSSQMGVGDLGYLGGVANPNWQGAPPEATGPLGVSYTDWDARYGGGRASRGRSE